MSSSEVPCRVFIGSDPRMQRAEDVLCDSIKRNATGQVVIQIMRHDKGEPWSEFDIGRDWGYQSPYRRRNEGRSVWATDFTNFRWAIPEVCEFTGRAIYLDVDTLLLGDIMELWQSKGREAVVARAWDETSVMLMNCDRFASMAEWPTIMQSQRNGWSRADYEKLLLSSGSVGLLPAEWNCLDGDGYRDEHTRILHYTDLRTQPWRSYSDQTIYLPHRHSVAIDLWWQAEARSRTKRNVK